MYIYIYMGNNYSGISNENDMETNLGFRVRAHAVVWNDVSAALLTLGRSVC